VRLIYENHNEIEEALKSFLPEIKESRFDSTYVKFQRKIGQQVLKIEFSENNLSPLYDITKDELEKLPQGSFTGKITVVDRWSAIEEIERAVELLRKNPDNSEKLILGMDIEWRPNFRKGESNLASVLQLCNGRDTVIFRLLDLVATERDRQIEAGARLNKFLKPNWEGHMSTNYLKMNGREPFQLPHCLINLLEDPKILKTGVGLVPDADKMWADFGVKVAGVRDILNVAVVSRFGRPSLQYLSGFFLKFKQEKSKKSQMCNWEGLVTEKQFLYAATDAYCSLEVYKRVSQISYEGVLDRIAGRDLLTKPTRPTKDNKSGKQERKIKIKI